MPNPNPIEANSPTVLPFPKDYTVHIPYTDAKTFADVVLLNHIGEKEFKSIVGDGIGVLTKKKIKKNDMGLSKESAMKWNMERKIDKWEKSQNLSSKQTNRTDPLLPHAHTEQVNVIFIGSGKSDDFPEIQIDQPSSIIVNNKIEKDKPIKTSKGGYHVKTKEYPFLNFSTVELVRYHSREKKNLLVVALVEEEGETEVEIRSNQRKIVACPGSQTNGNRGHDGGLYFIVRELKWGSQVIEIVPWKVLVRFGKERHVFVSTELSSVYDKFHVSNLKKCLANANLHVLLEEIKVDKTLHFVEDPIEIMDREVKKLKRRRTQKTSSDLDVLWKNFICVVFVPDRNIAVDPIVTNFNSDHLHRTDIKYAELEHGASSLRGPQLDPREIMEAQVESWFDEDVWINAEDHISTDEEMDEMTLRNMSFEDRMAYKSYVSHPVSGRNTRRQHNDSHCTRYKIIPYIITKVYNFATLEKVKQLYFNKLPNVLILWSQTLFTYLC
ncbi:hypothetical protein Tco_0729215 [Tanacetum coccineum]|uniref:Uncharacterized protein n=1 Tax=Tanacetum coccineum TaxID=301880 RepID=A0ABQ4YN88_9ASTR